MTTGGLRGRDCRPQGGTGRLRCAACIILRAVVIAAAAAAVYWTVRHSGAGALLFHPGTLLSAACILELARVRRREAARARRDAEQHERVAALSDAVRSAFRYAEVAATPARGLRPVPRVRVPMPGASARRPAAGRAWRGRER